jgi:hypothetical protein
MGCYFLQLLFDAVGVALWPIESESVEVVWNVVEVISHLQRFHVFRRKVVRERVGTDTLLLLNKIVNVIYPSDYV